MRSDRTLLLVLIPLTVVSLAIIDGWLRSQLARHLVEPSEARFRGWRNLTYLEPAL